MLSILIDSFVVKFLRYSSLFAFYSSYLDVYLDKKLCLKTEDKTAKLRTSGDHGQTDEPQAKQIVSLSFAFH